MHDMRFETIEHKTTIDFLKTIYFIEGEQKIMEGITQEDLIELLKYIDSDEIITGLEL